MVTEVELRRRTFTDTTIGDRNRTQVIVEERPIIEEVSTPTTYETKYLVNNIAYTKDEIEQAQHLIFTNKTYAAFGDNRMLRLIRDLRTAGYKSADEIRGVVYIDGQGYSVKPEYVGELTKQQGKERGVTEVVTEETSTTKTVSPDILNQLGTSSKYTTSELIAPQGSVTSLDIQKMKEMEKQEIKLQARRLYERLFGAEERTTKDRFTPRRVAGEVSAGVIRSIDLLFGEVPYQIMKKSGIKGITLTTPEIYAPQKVTVGGIVPTTQTQTNLQFFTPEQVKTTGEVIAIVPTIQFLGVAGSALVGGLAATAPSESFVRPEERISGTFLTVPLFIKSSGKVAKPFVKPLKKYVVEPIERYIFSQPEVFKALFKDIRAKAGKAKAKTKTKLIKAKKPKVDFIERFEKEFAAGRDIRVKLKELVDVVNSQPNAELREVGKENLRELFKELQRRNLIRGVVIIERDGKVYIESVGGESLISPSKLVEEPSTPYMVGGKGIEVPEPSKIWGIKPRMDDELLFVTSKNVNILGGSKLVTPESMRLGGGLKGKDFIKSEDMLKTSPVYSPLLKEFLTPKESLISLTGLANLQGLSQTQQTKQKEEQKQKQRQITTFKIPQLTYTKQKLDSTTTQIPRERIKPPPEKPREPPPIIIPRLKKGEELKPIDKLFMAIKEIRAYDVYVKRSGKYRKVADDLPRGKAIKKGAEITKKTLASSFKIVQDPSAKPRGEDVNFYPDPRVFRNYRIYKGRRIPLKDEWIEKRGKRLTTGTERTEIQMFRKAKKVKKGKFKLF